MSGERAVDLHTHSTASDGMLTPEQLVKLATETGLSAIGLTDHDTTAGLAGAQTEAERFGLVVVPGVELSSTFHGHEAHMLGYFIDTDNQDFQNELTIFVHQRAERIDRMIERLHDLGIPVDRNAVYARADSGTVGRPHLAHELIEMGAATDIPDAFDRYLAIGKPAYIPRPHLRPETAVQMIRRAGGAPVLAHPFSTGDIIGILQRLKPAGLVGMEVWYGEYADEQRRELRRIAADSGLIPTGGSDFHGPNFKPGRDLGRAPVPWDTIERLYEAAAAIRRAS